MKTYNHIFLSALAVCSVLFIQGRMPVSASAQDTINRNVTVERELQPTIRHADKLMAKPKEFQPVIEAPAVVYSEFSQPLSMEYNQSVLPHAETRFKAPQHKNGFLRVGAGYPLSLLDFAYCAHEELNFFAHHLGQWGKPMLSESELGFDYGHRFSSVAIHFGAEGGNEFFARHYMKEIERQANWSANAHVGFHSVGSSPVDWHAQVAYEGTFIPLIDASENALHTELGVSWTTSDHTVGLEADIQDRFNHWSAFHGGDEIVNCTGNNHRFHFEPYYAYNGKRVRLHAGVNLDAAVGHERPFGASPNVSMEAFLTKDWLAMVVEAKGDYEAPSVRQELEHNRFLDELDLFEHPCCGEYTPIDATLGFRMRPQANLLIDIYGGYAYHMDAHVCLFNESRERFFCKEQNRQLARVGAVLDYHYQDIIRVHASGNYYFDLTPMMEAGEVAFDTPQWDARVRIDGRINPQWSLYADAHLLGERKVCVQRVGECFVETLHPSYDVNLGVEYTFRKDLTFFAQLNNIIACTDELTPLLLYRTPVQGINGLLGLTWSF